MLRHLGTRRTHKQNVRLAALLCLTSGFVNVSGLLAFNVLTTNVTGHAALFARQLAAGDLRAAGVVGLWMLLFLAGAFCSSFYIGTVGKEKSYAYAVPILLEVAILALIGSTGHSYDRTLHETEFFAGSLLFAMGMQNAYVSVISGSAVRTTHLTGMFTDLGIDLSAVFYDKRRDRTALRQKITLKATIISFFLSGGVIGGYLFNILNYRTFYIPACILILTLFYDVFRIRISKLYRRFATRKAEYKAGI